MALGTGVLAGGAGVTGGGVESGITVLDGLGAGLADTLGWVLGESVGWVVGAGEGSRSAGGTIVSSTGTASPSVPRAVSGIGVTFVVDAA